MRARQSRPRRRTRSRGKLLLGAAVLCAAVAGLLLPQVEALESLTGAPEPSPLGQAFGEEPALIDAPFIDQRRDYPTGCESVTAVMALQYYGVDITVEEFIDGYLPQEAAPHLDELGNYVGGDPREAFLGSPYSPDGWGCYSPVIERALIQVVEDCHRKDLAVARLDGSSLEDLYRRYVSQGTPVLLWATIDMAPPYVSQVFTIEETGEDFQWVYPLHCLLWVGEESDAWVFNDPLAGKDVAYDKDAVETAYQGVGCQAVALIPDAP